MEKLLLLNIVLVFILFVKVTIDIFNDEKVSSINIASIGILTIIFLLGSIIQLDNTNKEITNNYEDKLSFK